MSKLRLLTLARDIPNPELWILGIALAAVCAGQAFLG